MGEWRIATGLQIEEGVVGHSDDDDDDDAPCLLTPIVDSGIVGGWIERVKRGREREREGGREESQRGNWEGRRSE